MEKPCKEKNYLLPMEADRWVQAYVHVIRNLSIDLRDVNDYEIVKKTVRELGFSAEITKGILQKIWDECVNV